jgi:hypothetical protein
MKRFGKLLPLTPSMFVLCLVTLFATPVGGRPPGRTIAFHTDGVSAFDNWIDLSNPADPVTGFIQFFATGTAARPAYQLFYFVSDANLTFSNSGEGPIPGSSVKFSGGSVNSGKMVVSLDVDTCQLDPTLFFTFSGPCGIIKATWTEIPSRSSSGFTFITRGTTEIIAGPMVQHMSGTFEEANALAQGTVIGSEMTTTAFGTSIALTHEVTVTTQFP